MQSTKSKKLEYPYLIGLSQAPKNSVISFKYLLPIKIFNTSSHTLSLFSILIVKTLELLILTENLLQ